MTARSRAIRLPSPSFDIFRKMLAPSAKSMPTVRFWSFHDGPEDFTSATSRSGNARESTDAICSSMERCRASPIKKYR
ncbi:hypothetical protein [Haladaptatus litoreus]|uniref:hypothetical protein n=1 Tax=Haladaptatus litoreus TaxID=553468 RepID=UPI001FE6FCB9|nr:hypothetical protein [Haladaptatus litoreus]